MVDVVIRNVCGVTGRSPHRVGCLSRKCRCWPRLCPVSKSDSLSGIEHQPQLTSSIPTAVMPTLNTADPGILARACASICSSCLPGSDRLANPRNNDPDLSFLQHTVSTPPVNSSREIMLYRLPFYTRASRYPAAQSLLLLLMVAESLSLYCLSRFCLNARVLCVLSS